MGLGFGWNPWQTHFERGADLHLFITRADGERDSSVTRGSTRLCESTYAESEARRVSCVCLIFLVRFFIKEKMNIEKRKQRSK